MSEHMQPNDNNNSDEIDLGELFKMIGDFCNNLFIGFLRVFLFIKSKAIILVVLIAIGVGIGLLLNTITTTRLKAEVIVHPNYDSKDYLYGLINEIENNIKTEDSVFLAKFKIELSDIKGFKVQINPLSTGDVKIAEKEYLEFLQNFKDHSVVTDAVKAEVFKKQPSNHKITFFYLNSEKGIAVAKKIISYINSNSYYKELKAISFENMRSRIIKNKEQIEQINVLVDNYGESLKNSDTKTGEKLLVYDTKNELNVTNLLNLRNRLVKDTEDIKVKMTLEETTVSIISFGSSQKNESSIYSSMTKTLPLVFVGVFFGIVFLLFFNAKAKEL